MFIVSLSSDLHQAKVATTQLEDLRHRAEVDPNEVRTIEEFVFTSFRGAFTELMVSVHSAKTFDLCRTELGEIHTAMDDALSTFEPDSKYLRRLQELKGILSLPEAELLTADIEKLLAAK